MIIAAGNAQDVLTTNEELIYSAAKRAVSEAFDENSATSSKRSRNKQEKFRSRINEIRGGVCSITGLPDWEASHIVPYVFWYYNRAMWAKSFNQYCFNEEDGIDDIRNGIALSKKWHTHFDEPNFHFTILKKKNVFTIKLSDWYNFSEEDKKKNGQVLVFNGPETQWPGAKFIKYHNDEFYLKEQERKLKASAEPKQYERQDSDSTIIHHFETLDDRKMKWIESQGALYSDSL